MDMPMGTTSKCLTDASVETNTLACLVCGNTFKQLSKLRSHLILHEAEKTFKCEFCGKLFSKSSNLYSHIRTHTGEKPYQCMVCKKYFPRMNNLRAHIVKIHQICRSDADQHILVDGQPLEPNDREVSNDLSEADTEDDSNAHSFENDERVKLNGSTVTETEFYMIHLDTVTYIDNASGAVESTSKKLSYKCKTCSKTMNHKSNMEDHVRSHSGLKLFKCKVCDKGLSRKQNLVHHLRHIHFVENDKIQEMITRNDEYLFNKDDPESEFSSLQKSVSPITSKVKLFDDNVDASSETEMEFDVSNSAITESLNTGKTSNNNDTTLARLQSEELNHHGNNSRPTENNPDSETVTEMETEYSDAETEDLDFNENSEGFMGKIIDSEKDELGENTLNKESNSSEGSAVEADTDFSNSDNNINKQDLENLPYIILNPDDLKLKMYECKTCGFKCKRRYYMAVEHVLSHTNYKPFLCVVCCKQFSRRTTLRGHLQKEHKFTGTELEELMETTGNKVPPTMPVTSDNCTGVYVNGDMAADTHSENMDMYLALNESAADIADADDNAKDNLVEKSNDFSDTEHESLDKVMDSIQKLRSEIRFLQDDSHEVAENGFPSQTSQEVVEHVKFNSSDAISKAISNAIDVAEEEKEVTLSNDSAEVMSIIQNESTMASSVNMTSLEAAGNLRTFEEELDTSLPVMESPTRAKKTKLKPDFEEKVSSLMDVQNLTCLLCKKACSNKSNLKQHVRLVHINMKEFTCAVCDKKFSTRFNLKVHWRQHTVTAVEDLKQFDCKKCGKLFTTKSYMKVHMTNKHGVVATYQMSKIDQGEKVENIESNGEDAVKTENQNSLDGHGLDSRKRHCQDDHEHGLKIAKLETHDAYGLSTGIHESLNKNGLIN